MNPFRTAEGPKDPGLKTKPRKFRCCVPTCPSKYSTAGLHNFPTDKERCWEWIENTKTFDFATKSNKLSTSHYKVCERHFQESDYRDTAGGNKRLKKNAVPSLYVPDPLNEHNYCVRNLFIHSSRFHFIYFCRYLAIKTQNIRMN